MPRLAGMLNDTPCTLQLIMQPCHAIVHIGYEQRILLVVDAYIIYT